MAVVPTGANFTASYVSLHPTPQLEPADKIERALASLFPDLLVYGTRTHLLNMTTALTKVSGRAHDYFARLSQILAFERMMRSFFSFAAATSPFFAPVASFTADAFAANCWKGLLLPAQPSPPSSWGYAAPTLQQPLSMPFLAAAFQTLNPAHRHQQSWPDYSSMFFVPVALWAALPVASGGWPSFL
jgi:hypothetical protein